MSEIDKILSYNKAFVADKAYEPYVTDKYPARKLAVLTCMDTRLTELLPKALGLRNGDAKIIKNAGGLVISPTDSAIRSLLVAIYELGVQEIMVVHHSSCGACHMHYEEFRPLMRERGIGDEAIATIVQEMENNRGDTVVIFVGYPDSMKDFFSRNPGLRSRVPFSVNFRDYGPKEMLLIAESEAKKNGFSISDEARGRITDICSKVSHSAESGNGRFCRNLVEKAILSYASRVYGGDGDSKKDQTLIADDFTGYVLPNEKKRTIIGF